MTETIAEPTVAKDDILAAILDRVAPKTEESNYKKLVIYGDPGAGKTVLAASAPRPLFYSTDTGFESLFNHKQLLAQSERIPYGNFKFTQALAEKAKDGVLPYETLVIDTFSGVADNCLKELSMAKFKKDPSREAGAFVAVGKDYQENTEQMKFIIAALTLAPMHVIYICHSDEKKDEATGRMITRPMLTPKLASKLFADASLVGFMTSELDAEGNTTRRLQVAGGNGKIWVKSRIHGLPNVVDNPIFDHFVSPEVYF